jgi:hypothetical protein
MKKILFSLLLMAPVMLFAQVGIKAGLNFAQVSKAADINDGTKSAFHVGLFLAPPTKSLMSSRTELIFSRQGYNYKTSSNSGDVNLDYIQFGQLASVNLTKFFSLMFGAQTAYLISAKVDSTTKTGNTGTPYDNLMDLYNRVDYGYALGAEAHPVSGLVIGLRYNVSLAKVYKDMQSMQMPSFTSEDAKNNVVQLSVGWRLGTKKMKQANKMMEHMK